MTNYLEPWAQGELPINVPGEVYGMEYPIPEDALQLAQFDIIRAAARFCVRECREAVGASARVVVRCRREGGAFPCIVVRATTVKGATR